MSLLHRHLRVTVRSEAGAPAADAAAPIRLVASTDAPISRFGGAYREVLVHDPAAVTLAARSVLKNHDPDQIVGKVVAAQIDGGRITADVQFAPTAAGREIEQLVRGGFVDGVSVGYSIDAYTRSEDAAGAVTITATAWTLREISITPTPADLGAGIGRAADDDAFHARFGAPMPDPIKPTSQPAGTPPQTSPTHDEGARAAELANARTERDAAVRALELRELAEAHGVPTEGVDFRAFKSKEEGLTALLQRKAKGEVAPPAAPVSAPAAPGARTDEHAKAAEELIARVRGGARFSDEMRRLGNKFNVRGIGGLDTAELIEMGAAGFHQLGKRATVLSSALGLVTQLAAEKLLLDAFSGYEAQYQRWCKEVFVPDFNLVTIADLGLSEFAAAAGEGEAYADNTPTIVGGSGQNEYLGTNFDITLVALYNDRAGLVFERLASLGLTAAQTLDKISQVALAGASFSSATQALALSEANLPTAYIAHALAAIKGRRARNLIVPVSLLPTALSIVTPAGGNTTGRIFADGSQTGLNVICGEYLTDQNDWYLGADARLAPMVVLLRHPDYKAPKLVPKGEGGGPAAGFRVDFPAKAFVVNTAANKPLCGYKCTVT